MTRLLGLGIGFSFLSALMYGFNIVYARMAAQGGLLGPDLILHRIALMLVCVAAFFALMRKMPRLPRQNIKTAVILGLMTAGVGLFYFSAVAFVPVAVAAIVFYTFPLMIMGLGHVSGQDRMTPARLIVFGLCFLGLIIAIGLDFNGLDGRGIALALAAAFCAALQYVTAGKMGETDTANTVFWVHVVALPIIVMAVLALGGPAPLSLIKANFIAYGMATLLYFGGLTLLFAAMKHINPSLSGLIFYSEPVVAVLAASLLLHEVPSLNHYLGGSLVLASLIGLTLYELKR